MANWFDVYRGVVLPRHCDHYGHMNVRFYAQFFDDAGFQLFNFAGITQDSFMSQGIGVVIAKVSIDFIQEIKAGRLVRIEGAYRGLGSKSVINEMRMFEADSNTLLAKQKTVEVFFDLEKRTSAAVPEYVRLAIEPLIIKDEE